MSKQSVVVITANSSTTNRVGTELEIVLRGSEIGDTEHIVDELDNHPSYTNITVKATTENKDT